MNAKFFEEQRREMVAAIRAIAEHIAAELGKTALDERVLRAMAKVPRHEFVPVEVQSYAISYALPANVNLAFLGSNSAGDWAVGDFWARSGTKRELGSPSCRLADRVCMPRRSKRCST